MKIRHIFRSLIISIGFVTTFVSHTQAKVVPEDAKQLSGQLLTSVGAEKKANDSGTIPRWTGAIKGLPDGLKYSGSGDVYPDPYYDEKPIFVIDSLNFLQHKEHLTAGQIALINRFPDTFNLPIYPSHRDFKLNALIEERTLWNATRTELVNGIDGLKYYTGGVPFPIPNNGAEVLWNARVAVPNPVLMGIFDDVAVYLHGNRQVRRQQIVSEYPFAYSNNAVGKVDKDIGMNAGLIHVIVDKPERQKGMMTIVHEALDQVEHERKAWVYIPGTRRVRRAPTVGYDTPDGPGGLITIDDTLGFNGAMDRYNWRLEGKREIYIPYHNYKFDDPKADYETLLLRGHPNPEFMRYELHRVWVVEAELKKNARHVYAKRRFYIDEDSWQIVLLESYDGRGELWRVGILNTLYDFNLEAYVARAQTFFDLQSGAYIALRLVNQSAPVDYGAQPKGEQYYTPANLRKMGNR